MRGLLLPSLLLLAGCVFPHPPDAWVPARMPFSAEALVELKRSGAPDLHIRRELGYHGVEMRLTADDLIELKKAGAGDSLLKAAATAPVRVPEEAKPVYFGGTP